MNAVALSFEQQTQLRWELKHTRNLQVYRRAAALLALHGGRSVGEVAELLGVTRQSVYNWAATYGQAGDGVDLADASRTGRPSLWSAEMQSVLEQSLRRRPAPAGRQGERWTIDLLQQQLASQCGRRVSTETLRRKLRKLGYVWKEGNYVLRTDGVTGKNGNGQHPPADETVGVVAL